MGCGDPRVGSLFISSDTTFALFYPYIQSPEGSGNPRIGSLSISSDRTFALFYPNALTTQRASGSSSRRPRGVVFMMKLESMKMSQRTDSLYRNPESWQYDVVVCF